MSPRLLASAGDFGAAWVEEIAALVILAALFYWKLWPYLRKAMDQRRQAISSQLSAGAEAAAEAAALVEARRAAVETAKVDAQRLVEQARATSARLVAEGDRRAAEEYERLVAKAATDVELERARLRDEVVAELSVLVVAGATEVVQAELDAPRQHRLIGEAIAAAETEVA